ncbi:MAG: KamA family radical SAM protein [Sphaerochaetaceae bacterium]
MICSVDELQKYLKLTDSERRWFSSKSKSFPFLVTPYYLSLIDPDNPNDPIRRQVIPLSEEFLNSKGESLDPQRENSYSVLPNLVHRYDNRAALLLTNKCATNCRHCFRRRYTSEEDIIISEKELKSVLSYLKENLQIKEMLLTGGDPLTLSNQKLDNIIGLIREARKDIVLRLGSRVVVTAPKRITESLVSMLKKYNKVALYLLTQFNHPKELTKESLEAVSLFIDNGIPVLNQCVLLRGVNDDVTTLETLMNSLVANRIKPYYLFQGDLVSGTAHLRVPLKRGLELEYQLRKRLSGLAMPQYAVDLPKGGGKVSLGRSYLKDNDENGNYCFETMEGERRIYSDPTC